MKTTTAVLNYAKTTGAVLALAIALFFGYSAIGYVADSFNQAFAANPTCGSCGGGSYWNFDTSYHWLTNIDGGGGGGGGFTPYCTLSLVHTLPNQYTFSWTAPTATSFSINNGIGSVTPASGGSVIRSSASGTYIGTAVTPYGTVTCQTAYTPPPNPPYCTLSASPTTIDPEGSSTLTWLSTNGATFVINNGVGSVTPVGGGSVSVSPVVSTTYTGTITSPQGATAQCQTTVTVPPPAECKLEIRKTTHESSTYTANQEVEYYITFINVGDKKCTGSGVKIQDTLDPRLTYQYQSEAHSPNVTAGYAPDPVYKSSDHTLRWNAWDLDPGESGWVSFKVKVGTPTECTEFIPNKAKISSYEYNNFGTWVESAPVHITLAKDCTPPPPPLSCGLDIALILDASGTIDSTEAAQMKTAVKSFVDTLLPATPTQFSLTKFNTTATVLSGFTTNASTIKTAVDGISTGAWTNWEQGLVKGHGTYDPRPSIPNVIIFASDGQPNRYGVNGEFGTGMNDPAALAAAVTQANTIKNAGTRIITLGVGSDVIPANLQAIASSGAGNYYAVSNYASLQSSLQALATELCGGTITVKKVIDQDGNLATTNDQTVASGWAFNVAGTPLSTGVNGMTTSKEVVPGTYAVTETQQAGYTLVGATCTGATHNGTRSGNTVSGIQVGSASIVSCVFYNTPIQEEEEECKLEIVKSTGDDRSYAPNENVEYTINVKNSGTKKCTGSGVKIQDILDSRLEYVSQTRSSNITAGYQLVHLPYNIATRTLTWNAWDLDPGETGWIKFVAKVGTPTACTETIHNKAKITAFEYNNFGTWVESNTVDISVSKPHCYAQVPYCHMSVSPEGIDQDQTATITWNSTNTTSASIDQGVGSVALSGSKPVSPRTTTTYTGTFTGPGGTVTCSAIVVVRVITPQCTLSVSASKIKTGQSVMVSWTSQNVTQGRINGIGTTTPVSGGSAEVFPPDNTTYTGTFTGPYGSVTCSAPVEVEKGTTGCQGNCGGGLNQPNVVMLQKPPEAPLAFVTLEQIPYTGFAAGKALTLAFWLAVGLLAAAVTYFAMGHRALQFVLGGAVSSTGIGRYDEYETQVEAPRPVPSSVVTENRDQGFRTNGYAATVASVPVMKVAVPQPVAKPAVDGIPELADVIESRAHGAGVLMSPEAVTMTLELSRDRGEVLRQFGEILNEAVRVLPREDGWVMLTSERFENLANSVSKPATLATPTSTPSVEAILNSVMPPVAPTQKVVNVEMPMANADDQSVVMSLAQSILAGNRDQAYATLRSLEAGRANAASVMTVIAGACDQLFRARRHGLTTVLSVAAIDVSDEKLTKIVEVFAHGMDAAYANPFTSLKLAVAQAFEARG